MKKSTLFGVIYFALSFGLFLYGFCAWRAIQGTSLLSMGVTQGRIFVCGGRAAALWRGDCLPAHVCPAPQEKAPAQFPPGRAAARHPAH